MNKPNLRVLCRSSILNICISQYTISDLYSTFNEVVEKNRMTTTVPNVDTEMQFSTLVYHPKHHKGTLVSAESKINDMLPKLRSSVTFDKTKPLPTSLQSDFIPEDILFALTQSSPSRGKLGPPTRGKSLNGTSAVTRPPPSSVWNYKQRNRFKHLLDHTPCVCGAGKDISFLYDAPSSGPHTSKPDLLDQSYLRKENETNLSKLLELPDSVIPEEYHIVKNKGVVGIQYHEDKYSTQPLDHEKHLVVFPSMNPTSRYEVIQLRNTFEGMMDKAGVNDLDIDSGNGPTQMHNLLELIKREQNIYNIVFNELIRQTTIECAERGELLHLVWNKYHQLLNKVPVQIMSLHDEVIAQRILDLRLTDELMRFKGTIGTLTSELTDVKEHDRKVTREAQKAQEDLRSALAESQKNASLLAEYHDLYELQRQRLQRQILMLTEERDIWCTAAYSLVLKVTEEHKLNTAKHLQLIEKSWVKLASHFTILLSDRDTDLITKIQGHVEKWRDFIEEFNISLKHRENSMRVSIRAIQTDVESYLAILKQKYIDPDNGVIKIPEDEFTMSLVTSVKAWLESVVKVAETFEGVILLNSQEAISQTRREIEGWTDSALKMFEHHNGSDSTVHHHQTSMLALNKETDQLLIQLSDRSTGENGVAQLIISFQTSLETWETRFMSSALGVLKLQESDWASFIHLLEEWLPKLNQAIECIGITSSTANKEGFQPHSSSNINDVIRKTQKWATVASNSVDSEDAKLVEQVSSLHSEMVRWMIQVLLRLAPDKEGNSQEAAEMALLGSASIPHLTEVANTLFKSLETFSNCVTLCCDDIVAENALNRQDSNEENSDYELNDLKRLKTECTDWIQTAQMLMSQLTGMSVEQLFSSKISTALSEQQENSHQESGEMENLQTKANEDTEIMELGCDEPKGSEIELKPSDITAFETHHMENVNHSSSVDARLDTLNISKYKIEEEERIEVLGDDANTHRQTIEGKHIETLGLQSATFDHIGYPDTKKAFEALAAVETLQNQLIVTEERAQLAEERAFKAEAQIVALEERIRILEKKQQEQVNQQSTTASAIGHSKSLTTAAAVSRLAKTHSPMLGTDEKEEKSGRKSGKPSSKSSKRN